MRSIFELSLFKTVFLDLNNDMNRLRDQLQTYQLVNVSWAISPCNQREYVYAGTVLNKKNRDCSHGFIILNETSDFTKLYHLTGSKLKFQKGVRQQ